MTVSAFTPAVDTYVLDDLRDRLRGTRWPDQVTGTGWEQGTDTEVLRSFVDTWLHDFDWPAQQARLAAFDHVRVELEAGGERLGVHAVHARSGVDGALPVVLLHGWPSSFVQMLPIIPLLTGPDDPADAFDVVALSLPGYGFSDRPTRPGMDVARIAGIVVDVMEQLGHPRFAGRGSDLGAGVLQQLALAHPDRLVALHLSGTNPYVGYVPDDLSDAERQFVTRAQAWTRAEMAYAMEHSSKPQTLAHALNDSPAGLASWVLEKFRTWSDCGGDLDAVYSRADLLTNLTIYWATQTIGSSMRLYWETARSSSAAWGRVEVPTGMAMSGADMFPTPREWVERSCKVTSWTDLPRGGHFLEWEVPELVAGDMRAFLREYR
jgi:pimeloyl-ACP methyl ester carboxylesterase